ncbi:uncharacterized protein LOC127713918 [Mytilus californianus]|uniref:uncharacterized protein LOC127713918 n=1 Tax=Mytilus californianus TaxID=6549 RepID=UPI0022477290|nr:uncharacterized protein LOC127713918 [Mytilus californianus]
MLGCIGTEARIAREKYYKHRTKAQENPQQYLSLIIDNMDQSKTNLPRFPFVSKNNGGSLPPTLYLQADNAAKDNKNNYVLMFLAMLVKAEIVKKIKLSFLMVGHTHEDVDQFFSRISVKCHQQAAVTLPDLHQLISTSIKPMPYIEHITSLWDFRKLSTSDYSLCDFKDIHHFVFSKADDKVSLKFKNWPLHSEPYRELDVTGAIPDLEVPSIVEGIPPKFSSVVTNMSEDLEKWMSTGR